MSVLDIRLRTAVVPYMYVLYDWMTAADFQVREGFFEHEYRRTCGLYVPA